MSKGREDTIKVGVRGWAGWQVLIVVSGFRSGGGRLGWEVAFGNWGI